MVVVNNENWNTIQKYLLKKKYSVRCKVAVKLAYAVCHDPMIQNKNDSSELNYEMVSFSLTKFRYSVNFEIQWTVLITSYQQLY